MVHGVRCDAMAKDVPDAFVHKPIIDLVWTVGQWQTCAQLYENITNDETLLKACLGQYMFKCKISNVALQIKAF